MLLRCAEIKALSLDLSPPLGGGSHLKRTFINKMKAMLAFFFNLSLYFYCCFRNGSVCPIFQSVVKTLERVGIIERELGACKIFLLRAKSKKKKKNSDESESWHNTGILNTLRRNIQAKKKLHLLIA